MLPWNFRDFNPEQLSKAPSSIDMPLPNVNSILTFLTLENTLDLIFFTVFGMINVKA